jgi:hypothetical protein
MHQLKFALTTVLRRGIRAPCGKAAGFSSMILLWDKRKTTYYRGCLLSYLNHGCPWARATVRSHRTSKFEGLLKHEVYLMYSNIGASISLTCIAIRSETRPKLHPEVTHRIPDCWSPDARPSARRPRWHSTRSSTLVPRGGGAESRVAIAVLTRRHQSPDVSREMPMGH